MLTEDDRVILGIPSITLSFVNILRIFLYLFYGYLEFLGMLFENCRVILGIQGIILVSLPMFTRYNLSILTCFEAYTLK